MSSNHTLIKSIYALEVLDSRGWPTLQVTVVTLGGFIGKASIPSGSSRGKKEAFELRASNNRRYKGQGVLQSIDLIHTVIAPMLEGKSVLNQSAIDTVMIEADGTPYKTRFGGNTILAVSWAVLKAGAVAMRMPPYLYLAQILGFSPSTLPLPLMNVINGGVHADSGLAFQEFMICPVKAPSFKEALRWGAEIYHTLKHILQRQQKTTSVGDEGGFAPRLSSHEEALDILVTAIHEAGYRAGEEVALAIDCAASQYYQVHDQTYLGLQADEYYRYLNKICTHYPIIYVEDPFDEDDFLSWTRFKLPVEMIGDDLFASRASLIASGVHYADGVIIKPNQVGSVTETLESIETAKKLGYTLIVSHRSGETEDTILSDLAVAAGAKNLKAGAPCRMERVAKYNRILEIEAEGTIGEIG